MTFNNLQKNTNGFTLIELLVVIAIVALLSTIVLGSINQGRVEARNTAKNSSVGELITALELYYDTHDGYPYYGDVSNVNNPEMYCIGYGDGEECFGFYPSFFAGFVGDDGTGSLNDALDEYISGPPRSDTSVISGNYDYKGIVYGCSELGATCSQYSIWWYLENNDSECARGAESLIGGQCRYFSDS